MGRVAVLAADGVGDLGYVDVAVGVYGDAVGGDELSAALTLVLVGTEHADAVAFEVIDADAVAEAGGIVDAAQCRSVRRRRCARPRGPWQSGRWMLLHMVMKLPSESKICIRWASRSTT